VDNNSSAQRLLDEELDKLEKGETTIYSDYAEQFQYAAAFALLLLIIEVCILDRRNPILKKIKLFKR
jgi:Ca-activated chloride channel family protein